MKVSVLGRSQDGIWKLPRFDEVTALLLLILNHLSWWDHPAVMSLWHRMEWASVRSYMQKKKHEKTKQNTRVTFKVMGCNFWLTLDSLYNNNNTFFTIVWCYLTPSILKIPFLRYLNEVSNFLLQHSLWKFKIKLLNIFKKCHHVVDMFNWLKWGHKPCLSV